MSTFDKLPRGGINYTELGPRETMWKEAEEDMLEEPAIKTKSPAEPFGSKQLPLFTEAEHRETQELLELSGLDGRYYQFPEGCRELQDLIEHRDMNFNVGNIFKAAYRLGNKPGVSKKYDLEKIIFYAQRELDRC